jgi:ornithine cyclodeaminase
MSILYLTHQDLVDSSPDSAEIINAVEQGVFAHGEGRAVAAPTLSLSVPEIDGALYVVRGAALDLGLTAIKSAGAFPTNRARGLAPDAGLLVLHDIETGMPRAILEGSFITTTRTAAMTALGTTTLASPEARVLGCVGARGIAALATRMIAENMKLDEIRIHSASQASRDAAVQELSDGRAKVLSVDSWGECIDGADIVIDGPGLTSHQRLLPSDLIAPGATVISFGAYSSFDDNILEHIDRVVMDRWADGTGGPLGPFIGNGKFSEAGVHAWFGDILAGRAEARTEQNQRVLLWHRGLGVCDITLAAMLLERAQNAGLGTTLPYP